MKDEKTNPALAELMEPEQEAKTEIAPGMTVEEIRALYFNADALKEPPYRVYRLDSEGHRYYYRFNENGDAEFFPSVTTLLKQVMPTSPFLIDWMLANGKEGATEKRDLAAAYGTFMHGQFEQLIINRRYDFDKVPEVLLDYMERENLPDKVFPEWAVRIRKDVLAFAQFVRDYNVRPLAVEIALVHPDYRFAGCIDLPCVMTDPKTAEEFTAIVDFKSGRKGFYEEHELQLHLYREMWVANYPEHPIERLYNFAPKDWRGAKPTYTLKDQTGSENAKKLPFLLGLATIEDEKRENTLTVVRGVLDLDSGKLADNILTLSLSELIKSKTESKDAPEQAAKAPLFSKEEIERIEKALGVSKDASEKAAEMPVKRRRGVQTTKDTSETGKARKTEIDGKLPWEQGEPDLSMGSDDGFVETDWPNSENSKQAVKDNLLNDEIEF